MPSLAFASRNRAWSASAPWDRNIVDTDRTILIVASICISTFLTLPTPFALGLTDGGNPANAVVDRKADLTIAGQLKSPNSLT